MPERVGRLGRAGFEFADLAGRHHSVEESRLVAAW
jgi:hypothetical protein